MFMCRKTQVNISLGNPLDYPVTFSCECSNTKHFIIPALTDSKVGVMLTTSTQVCSVQGCTNIDYVAPDYWCQSMSWRFHRATSRSHAFRPLERNSLGDGGRRRGSTKCTELVGTVFCRSGTRKTSLATF